MRFERTHRLPCLSDFKSAPFDLLGTAPYKKLPSLNKTAAVRSRDPGRGDGYNSNVLFVLYESMPNCSADERSAADRLDCVPKKSISLPLNLVSVHNLT